MKKKKKKKKFFSPLNINRFLAQNIQRRKQFWLIQSKKKSNNRSLFFCEKIHIQDFRFETKTPTNRKRCFSSLYIFECKKICLKEKRNSEASLIYYVSVCVCVSEICLAALVFFFVKDKMLFVFIFRVEI